MLSVQKLIFMLVIDPMVVNLFARNFNSVVQHTQKEFIFFPSVIGADDKGFFVVSKVCVEKEQ